VLLVMLAAAATTLVIYPLREIAPEVSPGVVYLLAVLLVAVSAFFVPHYIGGLFWEPLKSAPGASSSVPRSSSRCRLSTSSASRSRQG